MSHWAKPGAKGICITRRWWDCGERQWAPGIGPRWREVVTIRRVVTDAKGRTTLSLRGYSGHFNVTGFRPVVRKSQKQDVAQFAHWLLTAPASRRVGELSK